MASIIGVYCLWVPHAKYLKFSSLIKGMFYAVYYAYYDGWFLVWGYTVVFLFSFYILIKDEERKVFYKLLNLGDNLNYFAITQKRGCHEIK